MQVLQQQKSGARRQLWLGWSLLTLVLSFSGSAEGASVRMFRWTVDKCNETEPMCLNLSGVHAPKEADACLQRSGPECSITLSGYITLDRFDICIQDGALMMDLRTIQGWKLYDDDRRVNLVNIDSKWKECRGWRVYEVEHPCSENAAVSGDITDGVFIELVDGTWEVPRTIDLRTVSGLAITSPETGTQCPIYMGDISLIEVRALYSKTNVGSSSATKGLSNALLLVLTMYLVVIIS